MTELLILGATLFGFAQFSRRLAMTSITAPMVFTAAGIITGPAGLGWFQLGLEDTAVAILVEATLVLVLFTDAIRIDLRVLKRESWLPIRLLAIGLPLCIVTGTVLAKLIVPDLGWIEAALLAAILAPTDAALGQAVVSDRRLPPLIRQGLNVESGLNDGIVVPVVTVLIAVAVADMGTADGVAHWAEFLSRQIGFGVMAGVLIGGGGGTILHRRAQGNHIEHLYLQLGTIAIGVGAFAAAEALEGNGFIAAFVAGLAFGQVAKAECDNIQKFTEDEGELFSMITFLVFGAVLIGPRLDELTWSTAAYAVLSLTVIRMVPVLIALIGSGTRFETRLFAGWFGPRGLASILFALLVVEQTHDDNIERLLTIAMWTVLLSVFAHGLTASPWAGRLGRILSAGPEEMPEMGPVSEVPTRHSERPYWT